MFRPLPAPSIGFALLYLIPTFVELSVLWILWRRIPNVAPVKRAQYKANLLGVLAIICSMTGAVVLLLRWH